MIKKILNHKIIQKAVKTTKTPFMINNLEKYIPF